MTPYLFFASATLVTVLLTVWRPDSTSPLFLVRAYLLLLVGGLVLYYGLVWAVRRIGFIELTYGKGLFIAYLGAGTAISALFRLSPYWEIASVWGIFGAMSDRVRKATLAVLGVAIMAGGIHEMLASRTAYLRCRYETGSARDGNELSQALNLVPNPNLRPYRGAAPYTCDGLLGEE